jgi:hypothetical protein
MWTEKISSGSTLHHTLGLGAISHPQGHKALMSTCNIPHSKVKYRLTGFMQEDHEFEASLGYT